MKIRHRAAITTLIMALLTAFSPLLAAGETEQSTAQFDSSPGDYRIDCGDVIEVLIWKEPDLSREVIVRLDGKITVPLLDDITAAGKTLMDLKNEIQTGLDNFLEGPFVTVTLKGSGSQKFYILGEVANTGEYTLTKKLTALQAFALAGGFTEWAQKTEILVFRKENGQDRTIRIDYKEIVKGKARDDVVIQANDTIIVP